MAGRLLGENGGKIGPLVAEHVEDLPDRPRWLSSSFIAAKTKAKQQPPHSSTPP